MASRRLAMICHNEKAEDEGEPDMRLANLNPTYPANPFHGRGSSSTQFAPQENREETGRVSRQCGNRSATRKPPFDVSHHLQNKRFV